MRIALTTILLALGLAVAGPVIAQTSCEEMADAFATKDTTSTGAYNTACCYAVANNESEAVYWLQAALRHGYRDAEWLQNDSDLASLHGHEDWSTILAACRTAEEAYLATINADLYHMFQADQGERVNGDIDWDSVSVHDAQRRERTRKLIADSALHVCDDYIHAAFVFQHGAEPEDYALAHELAMQAVALDSTSSLAKWIAAASKDRHLVSLGLPQWYATQFYYRDGRWTIDPIDTVNITDADRIYWGSRTLQQAREREAEMNGE